MSWWEPVHTFDLFVGTAIGYNDELFVFAFPFRVTKSCTTTLSQRMVENVNSRNVVGLIFDVGLDDWLML